MAIAALIGGTLATGSGLLVLMTWLETSLQKSLAPDEAPPVAPATPGPDAVTANQPVGVAA